MNWDCENVDNDETFDRVEAIERAGDDPIFSLSFGEFISLVRELSGRLASKRARNWPRRLVGRFDDSSSAQMVYNTNDGTRNRLRVWPIAGLDDLYVDSSRHLVERTPRGDVPQSRLPVFYPWTLPRDQRRHPGAPRNPVTPFTPY